MTSPGRHSFELAPNEPAQPKERRPPPEHGEGNQPPLGDFVGNDRVIAITAPMFGHMQGPPHPSLIASFSHQNHGIGVGQCVAPIERPGQQLIQQLRNTKPVGRLVVDLHQVVNGRPGGPGDVLLRDGDMLLVPKKTQDITVLGEVESPTSHIYRAGLSREDYIAKSGGATQKADRKRIYIVRANGDVVSGGRRGWFRRSRSVEIRPGDTIVVPLDTERIAPLPLWTSVTTIIYNLAIAILAIHSVSP